MGLPTTLEDQRAPRSKSENSTAYIPYYLGGPLEDKKLEFWGMMIGKLEAIQDTAKDMMAVPQLVGKVRLVAFVAKAIRNIMQFILAWHAEMLDQRRFMLTMASETEYRQGKRLREEIPRIIEQFTIWEHYSQWLRKQPGWKTATYAEIQAEYTRIQKEVWKTVEVPMRDSRSALLEMMIADHDGFDLETIRKLVRCSPISDDDVDLEAMDKLINYALAKKFDMDNAGTN